MKKTFKNLMMTAMLAATFAIPAVLQSCSDSDDGPSFYEIENPRSVYYKGEVLQLKDFCHLIPGLMDLTPENPVNVSLSEAGTLADKLAGKTDGMDALTVSGPVNDADIAVIKDYLKQYYLLKLDLSDARFKNDAIPAGAFVVTEINSQYDRSRLVCTVVIKLTLPRNLKTIGYRAFSGMLITNVSIPQTVTKIGEGAFYSNYISKGEIVIPDGMTEVSAYAFQSVGAWNDEYIPRAGGIDRIYIPESVTKIGDYAFDGISSDEVIIGSRVKEIGYFAFNDNAEVESIELPASVMRLYPGSLAGLTSLKTIYSHCKTPPAANWIEQDEIVMAHNAFANYNDVMSYGTSSDVIVCVPVGSGEAYKKNKDWSRFNIVESDRM